jgi:hypothetical protein
MTYTGAMVLPQNAVRLNENEKRCVEGGKPEGYYRKKAQKALKAQWAKMTPKQRKAALRKQKIALGGYTFMVAGLITSGGSIIGATLALAGYYYTVYTV